jgi:hypothetical protein
MFIDRDPGSGINFAVKIGIEETDYRRTIGHDGRLDKIAVPPDSFSLSHSVP